MERPEKGGLTLKSFLIGIVLVVAMTILLHLLGGFTTYFPEATTNSLVFAVLIIFLLSLFASKIGLTPQEHTVIYAMLLVSTAFAATWTFTIFGQSIIGVGHPLYGETSSQFMNPIFGPKDPDLIEIAFAGGAEVPWEAWLIPMFYWILLSLAMCFSGLFLSCIMRRQHVEVETLPFPMATPVLSLTEERSFFRLPNVKWILGGMLIGFVWIPNLFSFLNALHPPLALPTPREIDFAPYLWAILPMAVLAISWSNISVLAFGLLVPTDILLTTVVLHGAFLWIIPAIDVAAGFNLSLIANDPLYSASGQWLYRLADSGFKGVVHHNEILRYGGLIGLGILPLIYEWKHIARTLKAVIHPEPGNEASEPLAYRWSWIGFVATTIVAIFLMLVGGMPLWATILFLLLYNVLILGITRLRGESGGWMGNAEEMRGPIHVTLYQAGFESNPTTSAHWSSLMVSGTYTWWGFLIALPPPVTSTEAFRVASATKTRSRDLFVAISVAIIIAMLIGFPFALSGIYRYGINAKWLNSRIDYTEASPGDMGFWQNLSYQFYTGGAPVSWNYPPDWIQVGFGVILVGIFMFLRARYARFPLNPIGIPLAGFVLSPGYAFLWLVAYVIKYAALKIGGTKLYEEKLVPLAVGIILMSTILLFISGLVTISRVA